MNQSINDIINQYRSGGTGKSNANNVVDYYNQQIANIQAGQTNLANAKSTSPQDIYNQQTIGLYQNASNQASQLQDNYQKALEQQSLNKQYAQKYLNTQLGMQGLGQVGSSESSANAIASQYANNVANLQSNYASGLRDIESERAKNQLKLDTDKQQSTLSNYSNAIQNANTLEDLDRVKELYGNVSGNTELDNALYYKMQDLYTQKVDSELGKAIESGNNSREALTDILSQYKDQLSNAQYKEFENAIESEASTGEIKAYVAEGTEPIKIDAYTNATDLASQLNVNQGEKQTKYVETILNDLKSGKIPNGSFVQLNYGKLNNRYENLFYVYNGKLYQVDKTKAKSSDAINKTYIPDGYMVENTRIYKDTNK